MKSRNSFWLKKQQPPSNPFQKSNPYRLKAKFLSERKPETKNQEMTLSTLNPQSLKYSRNFKQSPPAFQFRKLSHIFFQHNSNFLSISRHNYHIEQSQPMKDYKQQLRQYVADSFCPSDPYLQIVKEKLVYLSNDPNSEFQNVMRMSNLGISRLTGRNNKTQSRDKSFLLKSKQNPFYRKSLIPLTSNDTYFNHNQPDQTHTWTDYFNRNLENSRTSSSLFNNSTKIPKSSSSPRYYYNNNYIESRFISVSNQVEKRSPEKQSNLSQFIAQKINYVIKDNNWRPPYKQLESPKLMTINSSFGPEYDWEGKKEVRSFLDAVIERSVEDPLSIQSDAPRQIKIKGKTFKINYVKRFSS